MIKNSIDIAYKIQCKNTGSKKINIDKTLADQEDISFNEVFKNAAGHKELETGKKCTKEDNESMEEDEDILIENIRDNILNILPYIEYKDLDFKIQSSLKALDNPDKKDIKGSLVDLLSQIESSLELEEGEDLLSRLDGLDGSPGEKMGGQEGLSKKSNLEEIIDKKIVSFLKDELNKVNKEPIKIEEEEKIEGLEKVINSRDIKILEELGEVESLKENKVVEGPSYMGSRSKETEGSREVLNSEESEDYKEIDGTNKLIEIDDLKESVPNQKVKIDRHMEVEIQSPELDSSAGENIKIISTNPEIEKSIRPDDDIHGLVRENIEVIRDSIVRLVETSKEGDSNIMKVKLNPEELGDVDLMLTMKESRLEVKMLVENRIIKDMFTNKESLERFNQSLIKHNINLEKLSVDVGQEFNLNQEESQRGRKDYSQNKDGNRKLRESDKMIKETRIPKGRLEMEGSGGISILA